MSNLSNSSQFPQPVQTFRVDSLSVRVYHSKTELSRDAATIARDYLQKILDRKGAARVILATGNSQIEFLDTWIEIGGLDWSKITFFHLDEYLGITPNHQASFRRYMLDRVEKRINPAAFHYIKGDALQPLAECDRYTQLLQANPIDLCCLGIGENGHLAFNDPSVVDFNDPHTIKLVKLDAENIQQQVNQGHFPTRESVPKYAFTLTIPSICSAQKIICLAPEKRKAQTVKKMLEEDITTDCPASILRRQEHATLFLDADSASLLSESSIPK